MWQKVKSNYVIFKIVILETSGSKNKNIGTYILVKANGCPIYRINYMTFSLKEFYAGY